MSNQEKESWINVPINILRFFWFPIILMSFFAFTIFGVPYIMDNTEFGKEFKQNQNNLTTLRDNEYNLVRTSNNCFVLKQTDLILISDGANDKSWFPSEIDTDLRIGLERSNVLGCTLK